MVTIRNKNFSLSQIRMSGQCFRMRNNISQRESLVALDRYLVMEQKGDLISFDCTQEEFDALWKDYFDLETDYGAVIAGIDRNDAYLSAAAEYGQGIRILHQDLWEMLISFLISQNNNITRIQHSIQVICEKYGEKRIAANGTIYFCFPTPEALAGVSLEDLNACGLGYRSKYISQAASSVYHGDIDLSKIRTLGYKEAKQELLKIYGVGAKVADCICLYALHQTEAFPRDTHINKALAAQYPDGFPFERYGNNSGILQQYIFYYDLYCTPITFSV